MKKYIILLVMASFAMTMPVLETGCSSPASSRTQAYQTLAIVGQTAKSSIDASAQLLKQGTITVEKWNQIATFYDTKFQPAYTLAVQAAKSDLSSVASPDLVALAAQLAGLVAQVTAPSAPLTAPKPTE